MLITQVELENIKSYRHAIIDLRPGTTAIRGPNGAGKTTLVEAIGFALFNSLPYSQAQFMREGERSGQVSVSFIGADEQPYVVVRRCGTPAFWYVYDPQIQQKVVEQAAEVTDWLREHLPLQGEIKLEAFFSDALGVQQGTFTSDFLMSGANRKHKFDALLEVDAYRRANEKLLDTQNHLRECIHQLDVHITGLQQATQDIDLWRAELGRFRADHATGNERLLETQTKHIEAQRRLNRLREISQQIERLREHRDRAEEKWQQAKGELERTQGELEEAETAQRRVRESANDYHRHLEASKELSGARQRQQRQQSLWQRRASLESEWAAVNVRVEQAEKQLAGAEKARQRVAELAPRVELQTALEQIVATAKEQVTSLGEVKQELAQLATQIEELTGQLETLSAEITDIETQRPLASLHADRRATLDDLLQEVGLRGERERELAGAREQLRALARRRQKDEADLEKARSDVAKLNDKREIAATLPELEAEWSELDRNVLVLRTNIKRHHESKLQSLGG